jgi:hypothetical protein
MIQAYTAHGMDEAAKLLEMEERRFENKLLVSAFHGFRLSVSSNFPATVFRHETTVYLCLSMVFTVTLFLDQAPFSEVDNK